MTQKVEQSTVAPAPTPQPISEQVPTVKPEPAVEKQPEPRVVAEPAPTVEVKPTVEAKPATEAKPKMLGDSLTSLLNKVSNPVDVEGKSAHIVIDPASGEKMRRAKEQIVARMCSDRPRYVSAFESIEFEGNVVKLAVPSEGLRDELLGERYYILTTIAEVAGVKGSLDMRIEIKEMDFKLKPIKLEDRIEHICKVSPELAYMQKALDMDFE